MGKFVLAIATTAFGFGVAVPALAQEGAPFTGPRVEVLAGYDALKDGSDGDSDATDGVVYGGAIGYDIQAGPAVFGLEGEITGSTAKTRANNLLAPGDRLRLDAGRDLYAGARIGYVVTPRAMLYAKGGYTNARLNARYVSGNTAIEDGSNLDGYRLGAGVEYKLNGKAYVKGEYRYSHYSEIDGFDIDADRHQVLAGVGVRF